MQQEHYLSMYAKESASFTRETSLDYPVSESEFLEIIKGIPSSQETRFLIDSYLQHLKCEGLDDDILIDSMKGIIDNKSKLSRNIRFSIVNFNRETFMEARIKEVSSILGAQHAGSSELRRICYLGEFVSLKELYRARSTMALAIYDYIDREKRKFYGKLMNLGLKDNKETWV